jgi:hypothetical protein
MLIQFRAPRFVVALLLGALILGCGVGLGSYLANNQYDQATQDNAEQTAKYGGRHKWFGFSGEDWTAVSTFGLFIATLALFGVTSKGIFGQIKDNRILQRAYLAVEPAGIRPFEGDDDRIACDVFFVNAGNLPASNVSWVIDRKYSVDPEERVFEIKGTPRGRIIAAPKAKIRKGSHWTTRADFIKHLQENETDPLRAWLYVWGRVSYHDGFNERRFTDFCHRYNLRGASGFIITDDKARYHEYGNGTDES